MAANGLIIQGACEWVHKQVDIGYNRFMTKKQTGTMISFGVVLFLIYVASQLGLGVVSAPDNAVSAPTVAATGVIKRQGFTDYDYGSHVLRDEDGVTLYALTSDKIDLDEYLGLTKTVRGESVSGYPLDGGPDYLNVKTIQ